MATRPEEAEGYRSRWRLRSLSRCRTALWSASLTETRQRSQTVFDAQYISSVFFLSFAGQSLKKMHENFFSAEPPLPRKAFGPCAVPSVERLLAINNGARQEHRTLGKELRTSAFWSALRASFRGGGFKNSSKTVEHFRYVLRYVSALSRARRSQWISSEQPGHSVSISFRPEPSFRAFRIFYVI